MSGRAATTSSCTVTQVSHPAAIRHVTEPLNLSFRYPWLDPIPSTYHSEVLEWSGGLNVLKSLLQILQLSVHLALSLLGALDGLSLKSFNSLDLSLHIVLLWLESGELLLDVGDDVLVLQDGAVVLEVDGLGLLGELLDLAARGIVALLEGGQGVGSASLEAELGAQVGPVDLESGGSLWWRVWLVWVAEKALALG